MNKLLEIKEKLQHDDYEDEGSLTSFNNGWNGVINLNLPILFGEWMHENAPFKVDKGQYIAVEYIITTLSGLDFKRKYTATELYQYWIDNIYNYVETTQRNSNV